MPAAIYLRVSPTDAEQETIENQRRFAEGYTRLYNIDLFDWYVDDQVTGTLLLEQRQEGARLLVDARCRKFDTLFVYRLDRLARDPRITLNAVHELQSCGVTLVSMTEGSFDTPSGRAMLGMLATFAGYERESILERTGAGSQRVAKEGTWMGGIPRYGYRVEGRKREARLVPCHDLVSGLGMSEVQVVRWVYYHCTSERGSCESAARYLNRLRARPRGGKIWYASTIYRMLTCTTYRGIDIWKSIERPCDPIVDTETWNWAQRALQEHKKMSRRNAKSDYLLGGLIKCGTCGSGYIGRAVDQGKKYRYYVCLRRSLTYPPKDETVRCSSPNIPARLEEIVWNEIVRFAENPGDVLRELEHNQETRADLIEQIAAERSNLSRELAGVDDQKDLILGLYRTRRINQAKVDQQFVEIDTQAAALKDRIASLDQRLRGVQHSAAQLRTIEGLLATLEQQIHGDLSFTDRRYILMQMVDSVVVQKNEVQIRYRFENPAKAARVAEFGVQAASLLLRYRQILRSYFLVA